MKTPPSILAAFTLATLLSPAPAAHAQQGGQDSNPPGRTLIEDLPKLVRVQVEWIEVPHTTYTRLMWEESERESATPHQSLDNTPLRRAVAELVEEGEARVIDTAMIVAPSGERARVESQNEHIYPTEIDRLPSALEVPAPAGQDSPQIHVGRLPFPVVFEMRPVGTVLQIEPEIDRRVPIIHLALSPEVVYLAGETEWGTYQSEEGEVTIQQPSFYAMKLRTNLILMPGKHTLAGAVSPHHSETGMPDRERKVMIFVKGDNLVAEQPAEDAAADPE